MHEDFIEFSLSSTNKGAVGFIPAQELAILTSMISRSEVQRILLVVIITSLLLEQMKFTTISDLYDLKSLLMLQI